MLGDFVIRFCFCVIFMIQFSCVVLGVEGCLLSCLLLSVWFVLLHLYDV